MSITLSTEARKQALLSLQKFCDAELEVEVSQIQATALLEYFLLKTGEGAKERDEVALFVLTRERGQPRLKLFRAAAEAQEGRDARVHGYVAPGSIERDLAQRRVRFGVVNAPPHAGGALGEPLPVVYGSLETPDLFKDGAEVVIEGRLAGGTFHADKVMAKCPSKFEAADPMQQASL